MIEVDYIVEGDYILTMDYDFSILRDSSLVIKDDKILDVCKINDVSSKYIYKKIIKKRKNVILPGLINTHTHAAMVYFRGLADDLPLKEWLEKYIWPAENSLLNPKFVYDAVGLACLEMLKAGITTYNDMYFFEDAAGEITKKIGMRAVLGAGVLDFPSVSAKTSDEYLENAKMFISNWLNDDLILPSVAPHALYTCSSDTLKKSKALAERYDVPLHIHLSETRWEVDNIIERYEKRPVEYLDSIGFLDKRVIAAHCVWLDDNEIELLAKRDVSVSHCVESNLKLASGFAPIAKMISSGLRVTFGTDGAASNNDLNILSEISTTAKLQKALNNSPTVLDAKTVILMATRWAAESLGLGEKIGTLEKGKKADIISITLDKPHLTPIYDICSHIVYSAMASDVNMVMVNGKLIIDDGRLLTYDEFEILDKSKAWNELIIKQLKLQN